ncbi:hypothetical protein N2152v2_005937 [Parachlorella kessleri]
MHLAGEYAGMPRSIRARLLNPRKKVTVKAPAAAGNDAAPMEQLQSVAVSASGRMALGPWLGPYSAVLEEHDTPTSPTLYVHYKGRVFSDLDGSPAPVEEGLLEQPASPRGRGALVAAAMPDVPRQRRDHSKELSLMASKGSGRGHNKAHGSPRFNAGLRRTRTLNQPRSGF